MPFINSVVEWVEATLGISPLLQQKLFATAIAIFILWLIRRAVLTVVYKRVSDYKVRYQWQKTMAYGISIIEILIVGRIWFEGFGALVTYLGLLSAGLAIALKDPIVNLAGWLFIVWRKPFEVGDRIQLGDQSGDVIDLRIFQFTLLKIGNWVDADQSTGRVIHVPNGMIFTLTQANYGKAFYYIWNEIPVQVTFESDWQKAKSILQVIAAKHGDLSESAEEKVREASRKYMIYYNKMTPAVYTSVKDSGVVLTIRYLCEPKKRRGSMQDIWEDVLIEFAKHSDIDLAYPTQRYFANNIEGKEGTKPRSDINDQSS